MFDIVANKKNSVDVDKFDYIERDTYNLGLRSSYDPKRLLVYSRVINNEICYHQKEVYNVYEMFHTRYTLFKQIYTHRVGKSIELMIVDAFMAASKCQLKEKANVCTKLTMREKIRQLLENSRLGR